MDDRILDGDTAIVTGAAQGIGQTIAETLAREGATVVLADIDVEGAADTADRIEADGGTATAVEVDITDTDAVRALVTHVIEEFGTIDVLVNNAGGSAGDDVPHTVDRETWDRLIELNLTGPFTCTHEVLPAMVEAGGGRIVFVSSVNALTGIGLPAYSAAKNGIHAFSRVLATQYGQYGIRSNVVCPGTIITDSHRDRRAAWSDDVRDQLRDQYPLGEFGTPADVANAVLFLVSELGRFVTGAELTVDGGLTAGLDRTFERTLYDTDRLQK